MTDAEAQEARAIKVTRAVVQEERDKFALLQPHEKEMFRVLVRDRRGVLKLSRHAYTRFYELSGATGASASEKRKLRDMAKGVVAVFLQSPRVEDLYDIAVEEDEAAARAPAVPAPAPAPTPAAPPLVAPPLRLPAPAPTAAAPPLGTRRAADPVAAAAAAALRARVASSLGTAAPPPGTRVAVRYDDEDAQYRDEGKDYEGTVGDALDNRRATVKFDDGTSDVINFTEPGIRILREAPAPAPAPLAPPPAAAAPAPMSTEPSPVIAAAAPAPAVNAARPPLGTAALQKPVVAPAPAPADHVPLLAGVRLFMFGAQDQLAMYDLRHLCQVPDGPRLSSYSFSDGPRPPPPADLTRVVDAFRPSFTSRVGGLDAVAIGICGCEVDKPVVFALQTLTVVGTDTVRISDTAVDMTLIPHVPLQLLVDSFTAQVPRFARQLLPAARYVCCEKERAVVDERLLATGIAGRPYELWRPPAGYAWLFPSGASATSASTDVAFLRAELNAPGGSLAASPAPAAATRRRRRAH